MHISTSNKLTTLNTSVTLDASGSIPVSYMLNKDFSEIYRSGTANILFRIVLDEPNLEYIGLAGLHADGVCESISFEYWNGSTYVIAKTYGSALIPATDATLMHICQQKTAIRWRITFTKLASNLRVGIAYIAAGNVWEVTNNGEEAGYSRLWSVPQYAQRAQSNKGMPTSIVIESIGISGSVKFSNVATDDVVNVWAPLQGYAVREGVFIVEDELYGDRSYYCYNCRPTPVQAHSQTRSLQSVSMSFDAWTGRTI